MRAWAMLVATTRRELVEVVFRPLTNSGTHGQEDDPRQEDGDQQLDQAEARSPAVHVP